MSTLYLAGIVLAIIVIGVIAIRILIRQRERARADQRAAESRAAAADQLVKSEQATAHAVIDVQTEQRKREADERTKLQDGRRDHFDSNW
jgi:flagellar biosynthesis/type III secretory pathway M-ring protein FliF/YscJ